MNRSQRRGSLVLAVLGVSFGIPAAHGQVFNWGGTNSNSWADPNNWSPTGPPVTGNEADFNGGGNGNTNLTLSGTQTVGSIEFDSGSAAYTIGGTGDTLNVTSTGTFLNVTGGSAQQINASISMGGSGTIEVTGAVALGLGSASSPGVITVPSSSTLAIANTGGGITTINHSIQGSGANLLLASASYAGGSTVVFADSSTYSGTTTQTSGGNLTIQIANSTTTDGSGNITSGPFGMGMFICNNSSNSPIQAVGADRTIANPFTFANGGFTLTDASAAAGGSHNLTLTGAMTFAQSRTLTVNAYSQTVTFGSVTTPASITLTSNSSSGCAIDPDAQLVSNLPANPTTVIVNDIIQNGTGTAPMFTVNSANNTSPMGIIQFNGASTYSSGCTINGQLSTTSASMVSGVTVQVGVSSVGAGTLVSSGPFGTGTLTWAGNSNGPGSLEPFAADRTVGNNITMTSGFQVFEPSAFQDPTVTTAPHNLTLTGNVYMTANNSKIITNDLPAGVALTFGSPTSPATINATNGAGFVLQSQSGVAGANGGVTIINDAIVNLVTTVTFLGALTVQNGGTVELTNSNNTYTGGTTVKNTTLLTTSNNFSNGTLTLSVGTLGGASATVLAQPTPGATAGVTIVPALSIDNGTTNFTSKLDLTNNGLVVDYPSGGPDPFTTIRADVIRGATGGSYTGTGIISSMAATIANDSGNAHKTSIGYAEASSLGIVGSGTFLGKTVDDSSILVRYTLAGDSNLDGVVNALDFNALANGYGTTGSANWVQGDYNNDGNVDSNDFALLAANYNFNIANVPTSSQPLGSLGSVVPEPTTMGLLGLSLLALRRRRTV